MSFHFADTLLEAIAEKGSPVCVGLDPVYEKLPVSFHRAGPDEIDQLEPIGEFCEQVLQVVAPIVPAVKIQSAYFERYGWAGVALYERLTDLAHELDLLVIGDVKRNDIGPTAGAYALGHLRGLATTLGGVSGHISDAVTVNGYFGTDGVSPFIDLAAKEGRGVFVLVRTSNPSAKAIQDFADASGRKFFEHMAEQVAAMGAAEGMIGQSGYSCLGAVVGATWPDEARALRTMMPQQIFLVPGYGAQGATAADCAASFKADGTGAIVNASRSVLFAHNEPRYAGIDWKNAVSQAARQFADDIKSAL